MSIYKLEISYDGTDFYGWQKQPNVITIQGSLESCLNKVFKTQVRTIASGRTDAGVHAISQIVKLEMDIDVKESNLKKALNDNLPETIRVNSVAKSEDFHPVFDAKWKVYRYYFSENSLPPILNRFVLDNCKNLNFEKMSDAASCFVGKNSFHNYFCVGTPVDSYVRKIKRSEVLQDEIHYPGVKNEPVYYLEIEGTGFLKQMVRLIVGTIMAHSEGKISIDEIKKSLNVDTQGKLSKVAPAKGLVLYSVTY